MSSKVCLIYGWRMNSAHNLVELDCLDCMVIFSSFMVQTQSSFTESHMYMNFTSSNL